MLSIISCQVVVAHGLQQKAGPFIRAAVAMKLTLQHAKDKLQDAEERCSKAESYSAEADERMHKQSQYLSTAKHKIVQLQKEMSQLSKHIKELQVAVVYSSKCSHRRAKAGSKLAAA